MDAYSNVTYISLPPTFWPRWPIAPHDGEVEVPSLFQGRRMWPRAPRIRRPWGPASGSFGAESNGGLGLGKLYGGRGLGSTRGPHMSTLVSRIGSFMIGKSRISLCRRVLAQTGLPAGHRTARGALWSTSRELWESFWVHSGDHFRPEFIPVPVRSFSRSQFALALALRLLFLVSKGCASVLKIDVELTEHTSCEAGRVSLVCVASPRTSWL